MDQFKSRSAGFLNITQGRRKGGQRLGGGRERSNIHQSGLPFFFSRASRYNAGRATRQQRRLGRPPPPGWRQPRPPACNQPATQSVRGRRGERPVRRRRRSIQGRKASSFTHKMGRKAAGNKEGGYTRLSTGGRSVVGSRCYHRPVSLSPRTKGRKKIEMAFVAFGTLDFFHGTARSILGLGWLVG